MNRTYFRAKTVYVCIYTYRPRDMERTYFRAYRVYTWDLFWAISSRPEKGGQSMDAFDGGPQPGKPS